MEMNSAIWKTPFFGSYKLVLILLVLDLAILKIFSSVGDLFCLLYFCAAFLPMRLPHLSMQTIWGPSWSFL